MADKLKAQEEEVSTVTDAPKVAAPAKLKCPNHPKNNDTVVIQGETVTRCAWCHAPLA